MNVLLKRIANRYEAYMNEIGRGRAMLVLLNQSDRTLEDMGISRHLLLQGVDAWPWREGEVAKVAEVAVARKPASKLARSRQHKRAIRELRAMTNAELSDIGISRSGIVDAVKNGRIGHEVDHEIEAPLRLNNEAVANFATVSQLENKDQPTQNQQNAAA